MIRSNLKVSIVLQLVSYVLIAVPVTAQRTWVVAQNPPIVPDFTDIAPAIAAAAPGDTLDVHAGIYSGFVADKALTIVANRRQFGTFELRSPVVIRNVNAGEAFRMEGFAGPFQLDVESCAGLVSLEQLVFNAPIFPGARFGHVHIANSSQVTMHDCWVIDLHVLNSSLLLTSSAIEGWPDPPPVGVRAWPAMSMANSDVTVSRSNFFGGNARSGNWPAVPAIWMSGGTLRMSAPDLSVHPFSFAAGGSTLDLRTGTTLRGPGIHSDGGVVVVDPDYDLTRGGGVAFTGTSQFRREEIYSVDVERPTVNPSPLCAQVDGVPGRLAAIAVSLPAAITPTPFGDLWLDAMIGSTTMVVAGVVPSSGQLEMRIDVGQFLRPGDATVWQGVVDGMNGIQLSDPVVAILGNY